MSDEVDFWFFAMQLNIKVLFMFRPIFWVWIARYAQITQNNKFEIILNQTQFC